METVGRIEPTLLEHPTGDILDVMNDLTAQAVVLGKFLHPHTAQQLASLVRMMNAYYSNLIEGHNILPRDIERALLGDFDTDQGRRNLQVEAAAHIRVQAHIDGLASDRGLPSPSSIGFIRGLHEAFYLDAADEMVTIGLGENQFRMVPGQFRSEPSHDNQVGKHIPPSSDRVMAFMERFEQRYELSKMGSAGKLLAIPVAHHRFNYIHPFSDDNGRVSRLMSHAMFQIAGVGAHGSGPYRGVWRGGLRAVVNIR